MKHRNIQWASKLLKTKNFVVLTDTESAIKLDVPDPRKLNSILVLSAHRYVLNTFYKGLHRLIKEYDKRTAEVGGITSDIYRDAPSKTTKAAPRVAKRHPKRVRPSL